MRLGVRAESNERRDETLDVVEVDAPVAIHITGSLRANDRRHRQATRWRAPRPVRTQSICFSWSGSPYFVGAGPGRRNRSVVRSMNRTAFIAAKPSGCAVPFRHNRCGDHMRGAQPPASEFQDGLASRGFAERCGFGRIGDSGAAHGCFLSETILAGAAWMPGALTEFASNQLVDLQQNTAETATTRVDRKTHCALGKTTVWVRLVAEWSN